MVVLASGVEAGEVIALADPTGRKGATKNRKEIRRQSHEFHAGREIDICLGKFFPN